MSILFRLGLMAHFRTSNSVQIAQHLLLENGYVFPGPAMTMSLLWGYEFQIINISGHIAQ